MVNLNPILYVDKNRCYTAHGSFVMGFRLLLPEVSALSENRLKQTQDAWTNLICRLPDNTITTRFDAFTYQKVNFGIMPQKTYLQRKYREHFSCREKLEMDSFLFFTYPKLKTFSTSLQHPFKSMNIQEAADEQNFINLDFQGTVTGEIAAINRSGLFNIVPLSADELKFFNFKYFNLFNTGNSTTVDYTVKDTLQNIKLSLAIGNQYIGAFSVYNEKQLPNVLSTIVEDPVLSTKKHKFKTSLGDTLGLYARYPHYLTTTIIKDPLQKWINQIRTNKTNYGRLASFVPGHNEARERMIDLEKELTGEYNNESIVRSNTTLSFWADEHSFNERKSYFETCFKPAQVSAYFPVGKHLKNLFTISNPLFAAANSDLNLYPNKPGVPVAFFPTVTNYQSDSEGLFFCDRFNIPFRMDIWDKRKKHIAARNFIMIAPTGSGKSVAMQELLRQFYEQDVTLVVVDIGNSFKKFTALTGDGAVHIEYRPGMSLGVNPFNRPIEELLSPDKLETLSHFIFAHIESEREATDNELNFLRDVVRLYVKNEQNFSFTAFADFIINKQKEIESKFEKELKYFDFNKMLINMKLFIGDGIYSFLYSDDNRTGNIADSLKNKKVIVFEIEAALETPKVLGVLLETISDAVQTNILSDPEKQGCLLFEEAAKTIRIGNVLSQIEFQYQTIRKKNGCAGMVLQSANQIPQGTTAKSIFDNTQIIYALENEKGYDTMREALQIKEEHTLTLLNSLTRCFDKDAPCRFSEMFIQQGNRTRVVRIDISKEQILAYNTDNGDPVNIKMLSLIEQGENLENAIEKTKNNLK